MTRDLGDMLHGATTPTVSAPALAQVRARAAQLERRRRATRGLVVAIPAAVIVLGVLLLSGRSDTSTRPASPATAVARAGSSREANQRIIEILPPVANARFTSTTDADPPRGGVGVTTYVYFRGVDQEFQPSVALDAYRSAFSGWQTVKDEQLATRSTLIFVDGDAWVSVMTDVGTRAIPAGYTVVINSRDSAILGRLVP